MRKFFQLFSKENSVRGASLILVITLSLSNILGLIRDRSLAKNIPFADLDIYFAAFRIPDTLFNFLILGAITAAFVPVFSDFIAHKKTKDGFLLANSMINTSLLVMALVAVIFYFILPRLVWFVVPEFSAEQRLEVIKLSRLLMLTPIFFSISYIVGGVLSSFKRFFALSIAPLVYNLSIIIGAVWIAPRYGLNGLVWSVVAGSFLHVVIQIPALLKVGFSYQAKIDWKNSAAKKIYKLMVPRSIGLGANQVLLTIYTAIGSTLSIGAITAFNFSNNIQTVPIVILGGSFATAVFPTLAHKISQNDKEGFAFYLLRAMRTIAFLLIPSSVVFILLRAQIIRLIIGTGKVSWSDTKMTALTLGFFSISLLAQGLIPLFTKAFFALKNTKIPMYASLTAVFISILLAYPLSNKFSVPGLALAFSLGSFCHLFLLYTLLRREFPEIYTRELTFSYLKIICFSFVMGCVVWVTMHWMANIVDMTRYFGVLVQTVVSMLVGGAAYILLSYIFSSEEIKWALTRKINNSSLPEMSQPGEMRA